MKIKDIELFNIGCIKNIDNMYAHTKDNEREKLKEHLYKTYNYFLFLVEEKNLDYQINFLANKLELSDETKKLYLEIFVNAIFLHDIGKINVNFQNIKMNNNIYLSEIEKNDTNHSLLSSVIYLSIYMEKIENIKSKKERHILEEILFLNSYAISKHHGSFDKIYDYENKLIDFLESGRYKKLCQHFEIKDIDPVTEIKKIYKFINLPS